MLGKIFISFLAVVVILGVIGFLLRRAEKAKGENTEQSRDHPLSQKTVDNVNDLNDRFNRARYMDRDGEQRTETE